MTDTDPDIAALLDQARKRVAREAKPEETREQCARRHRLSKFHDTLAEVWREAHLLTDEEMVGLSSITEAAKAKGTRKYRRWSGRTDQVVRATNHDDALHLDKLREELRDRRWERDRQLRAADCRKVSSALHRLGLPVPEYVTANSALWARISREIEDDGEAAS